jgi:hypothetical protein
MPTWLQALIHFIFETFLVFGILLLVIGLPLAIIWGLVSVARARLKRSKLER